VSNFDVVRDLRIGHVVEVSGTSLRIELDGNVTELSRTHDGRVYAIGQMGSVVKVHFGRQLVFGFVTLLRMRSEELIEQGRIIPPDADQRIMEVELFSEGTWHAPTRSLKFKRGVTTYPLPRQGVYLLTKDESVALYSAAEGQREDAETDTLVEFGSYVAADDARCRTDIDKMFSMHCAVLGSTGSGKSGAVAALLHGLLAHKPRPDTVCHPRIIIIDPHAEYGSAFGDRAIRYRAYDPVGHEQAVGVPVHLPYWLMSAEEFRLLTIGKTEREATSQHNVIYKALTHARMQAAGLVNQSPSAYGSPAPTDGNPHDAPRPAAGHTQAELDSFDRDKPRPFSLNELVNHIVFLQAGRVQGNVVNRIADGDFAKDFKSILDKIAVLRQDPRIKFMMKEWEHTDPKLSDIIQQFVGDVATHPNGDMRILDISGLPNEVAGPLTASVAQLLFRYKVYQTQEERAKDPVLLVCEEAHRYVPDRGDAEYAAAQGAIRRIAREGRKYGLGLMLVSQRPADIESTVISQCGTWLVLRLTNQADQQHVARFLPDGLSGMTKSLPNLGQQEAIFVGEGAALPARVRVMDLKNEQLPHSQNARFAEAWAGPRLTSAELDAVARRMTT